MLSDFLVFLISQGDIAVVLYLAGELIFPSYTPPPPPCGKVLYCVKIIFRMSEKVFDLVSFLDSNFLDFLVSQSFPQVDNFLDFVHFLDSKFSDCRVPPPLWSFFGFINSKFPSLWIS